MADRRRIVTLNAAGAPTTVLDLEHLGGSVDGTNLATNPSIEVSTANWVNSFSGLVSGGATLSRVSTPTAFAGSWSLQTAIPGTGFEGSGLSLTGSFTAGQPYTYAVWMRGNAGGEGVTLILGVNGDSGVASFALTTSWTRYTVTWTPASTQTTIFAGTQHSGSAVTYFTDAALVVAGSSAPAYFDGDSTGSQWNGTTGLSTSTSSSASLQSVGDTFIVKAPPKNQIKAKRNRRYGGSRVVGEMHDNATIGWKMLVSGSSVTAAIANMEAALAVFEAARTDLYFEWCPDGANSSVFYEIRGPITWGPEYSWKQMAQVNSWYTTVEMEVGPLALAAPTTYTVSSSTLPIVLAMSTIPGDAPALANVTLRASGGTSPPIWALLGWTKHPGTPLASSVAPFGIIEAETATGLSGWAAIGSDATYRGSNGIRVATSGAGTASASFALDPSVMVADDFSQGEIDIEIWARVQVDNGVVSPVLVPSLTPNAGASFGLSTYTAEYGSVGKPIVLPSTTGKFRIVRLGVITMPVDPVTPLKWNLNLAGSWQAGSTGNFGIDYLMMVPAAARACSKSGVANDASYAPFIISTSDTSKTIMGADLSGRTGSAALNQGRDSGLGGSPIELPAGVAVDMLLKLSSLVPDDPTIDATSEQISHTSVTGSVVVWPRYFLAKGT